MHKGLNVIIICFCTLWLLSTQAQAESTYLTRVRVIQAGKGPAHVDPGIQAVVREIAPVFKYTQFKILKQKRMTLFKGQEGHLSLPGKRSFVIVPQGMQGNRLQYQIRINAKGKPIFKTGVMLKNKSSVTIGGPRVPKGVLLIDIQGERK